MAIIEGLADLRDGMTAPHFKEVIASIIESIAGGKTLSQAMSLHPRVFDGVFTSLVLAGEESGRLPEVLKSLIDSLKWQDKLASQSKKLLLYPAFLGAVVLGVTFFMMIYLVPKLTGFLKSMGQEVPLQTRMLIATSDFFSDFWYLLLLVPILLVAGIKIAVRVNPAARYRVDAIKLALPIVGAILRKIMLSRFAGIFAMMYASGISIIDAIRTCENIIGNAVVKDGLVRAGRMIAEGRSLTAAFQHIDLFPPLVIRMLRIGENTGELDTALLNVSYFYNRDVREAIERLQAMIEPAMTLAIGLLLGWVMESALGPIYDVITRLRI